MADAIRNLFNRIRTDDGQALAEFSLVLAFVALVCVVALTAIGTSVIEPFEDFVGGLPG